MAINALLIYVFSFTTGFGLYELVVPEYLKKPYLLLLLPAGLGLLQLSCVDSYIISENTPINNSFYIDGALGVTLFCIAFFFNRRKYLQQFASIDFKNILTWRHAVFAVLLLTILAPIIHAGTSTTPYRVGIDQVGYAETAQFLVEGGTLESARERLFKEMSTQDLKIALDKNLMSLNFNSYVDTEFLLKALRWGFPATLATLTIVSQNAHVFRIEFLVLIFSYALSLALIFHLLRTFFKLGKGIAFAIMIAVALNCNALNVYYEGQLAQVFMAPYFLLMILLFAHVRSWSLESTTKPYLSESFVRSVILFGILLAGMFADYNEAIILIFGVYYMTMFLDVVLRAGTFRKVVVFLAGGIALGFTLMAPLSVRYVSYTFANLANVGNAGFWQPHWGSLAEIVGFLDMYTVTGYAFLGRSDINAFLSIAISVALAAALVSFLCRTKNVDKALWFAPFVLVLAAYIKLRYLDHFINYAYFKIYTMLLPMLACACLAALYSLIRKRGIFAHVVFASAIAAIALNGLLYIDRYVENEQWVTNDMFALYTPGVRMFSDNPVMIPSPNLSAFMLVPLVDMNWIGENNLPKVIDPWLAKTVYVVLRTEDLTCRSCFTAKYSPQIVMENPSYVVFDSKMTVAQMCPDEQARMNAETPLVGSQDVHTECKYDFPHTLQWVR